MTKIIGRHGPFSHRLYNLGDMFLLDALPSHDVGWVQTALMLGCKLLSSPSLVNLWHNH